MGAKRGKSPKLEKSVDPKEKRVCGSASGHLFFNVVPRGGRKEGIGTTTLRSAQPPTGLRSAKSNHRDEKRGPNTAERGNVRRSETRKPRKWARVRKLRQDR